MFSSIINFIQRKALAKVKKKKKSHQFFPTNNGYGIPMRLTIAVIKMFP